MRNHYLLGLGGMLLATTALSSAATAATVVNYVTSGSPGTKYTAKLVGAELFGTGLQVPNAAASIGPHLAQIVFTGQYNRSFNPNLYIQISGASFSTSSLSGQNYAGIVLLDYTTGGVVTASRTNASAVTDSNCGVGVVATQIQITNCYGVHLGTTGGNSNASFLLSGIALSGLVYTAATGLATAGTSISITGYLAENANLGDTLETLASTALVTSVNTATVAAYTSSANIPSGSGTTPFATTTQSTLGQADSAAKGLTVTLAEIDFTGTGALQSDLTTLVTNAQALSAVSLTLASSVLADPAISNVRFWNKSSATSIGTATTGTSTSIFSSSVLGQASVYPAGATGTNWVQVEYNGTTSITGGAVGTSSVAFVGDSGVTAANPSYTGTTSPVSRATFNADVNFVQPSANTVVTSYIRVTNTSAAAGVVTMVVHNANTGATIGTYATASLPSGATVQVSAASIEAGSGITSVATTPYNITVSGPITGYVQHVTGNGSSGVYTDFSARRTNVGGASQE